MVAYQLIIRRIFPTYNLSLPILPNTEYLKRNIEEKYLAKVNNYKIALCLAGSKKSQNWDVDNFKKLIEIMEYKNITFFIVFSPWIPQDFGDIVVPLALILLSRPISYYLFYQRNQKTKVKK